MNYELRFVDMLNAARYSANGITACAKLEVNLKEGFPLLYCDRVDFNDLVRKTYSEEYGPYTLKDLMSELSAMQKSHTTPMLPFLYGNTEAVLTIEAESLSVTLFDRERDLMDGVATTIATMALIERILCESMHLLPGRILYVCACSYIRNVKEYDTLNYSVFQLKQKLGNDEYSSKSPKLIISAQPRYKYVSDIKNMSLVNYEID